MGIQWTDGYSALVEIFLEVNGQKFNVERVGKDSITMRDPCDCQPNTRATLVIRVDDWEKRSEICLTNGLGCDTHGPVPFT